jgi:hypothetical protein
MEDGIIVVKDPRGPSQQHITPRASFIFDLELVTYLFTLSLPLVRFCLNTSLVKENERKARQSKAEEEGKREEGKLPLSRSGWRFRDERGICILFTLYVCLMERDTKSFPAPYGIPFVSFWFWFWFQFGGVPEARQNESYDL